ncbi:MAG: hypothetical protein HQM16_02860 [Deltaproteobacteria bacterium]|nr:hypothetical protein [Deltaproteobacteria bacterium]
MNTFFIHNPHKAENTTRADTMQKLMPKRVEKTFQGSKDTDTLTRRSLSLFTGTVLRTLIACILSFLLFPVQSGIISVFFLSFALIPSMDHILEKNKSDVWQKKIPSLRANIEMAAALIVIFLAVLASYAAIVMFTLKSDQIGIVFFSHIHDTMTHTHLVTKDFAAILKNRYTIFVVFFLVSLVYRVGFVFVLTWLASVWGVIYGMYFRLGFTLDQPSLKHHMIVITVSGFFVLLIRTLALITSGMSGIFLSKALGKYKFASSEFKQVLRAVLLILLVSLVLLFAAVCLEFKILNPAFGD